MNSKMTEQNEKKTFREWVFQWFDRLPRAIRFDFGRKAGTVLLVALIYVAYYTHPTKTESYHGVRVDLELAPGMLLLDHGDLQVELRLRGNQKQLDLLSASDLQVKGRISGTEFPADGRIQLALKKRDVTGLPLGVQVEEIVPHEIMLNLDREQTLVRPVKVEFGSRDQLPAGFNVGRESVVPAEVMLRGPEKLLQNLQEVATKPVPLDQAQEGFEYQADLLLPGGVTAEPPHVTVQVELVQSTSSTQLSGVPVQVAALPGDARKIVRITPEQVTVTLNGPGKELSGIKAFNVLAAVPGGSLVKPGVYRLPVRAFVDLPQSEVKVRRILPEEVEIEVK